MQINFFFNEYINNNIYNLNAYHIYDKRPGLTLFYQFLVKIPFMNYAVSLWLLQFIFLALSSIFFYEFVKKLYSEKISFVASIIYVISPYTINLARVIDIYPLMLLFYSLTNLFLIKYIKEGKNNFIFYSAISLIGLSMDLLYLTFIIPQTVYLLIFHQKDNKKIAILILSALVIFTALFAATNNYREQFFAKDVITKYEVFADNFPTSAFASLKLSFQELTRYGAVFFYSLFLILIIGLQELFKRKNLFVTFNLASNVVFFLLLIFPQFGVWTISHPETRNFLYIFYWLYIIAAIIIIKLIKKKWLKIFLIILFVGVIINHGFEFYHYYTISENQKGKYNIIEEAFIYDSLIFIYDEENKQAEWSSLKKYPINPFKIRALPTKNLSFVKNKGYYFEIFVYSNLIQYENHVIIFTKEHLTNEIRDSFTREFINAAKDEHDIIFVPICCNQTKIKELTSGLEEIKNGLYINKKE